MFGFLAQTIWGWGWRPLDLIIVQFKGQLSLGEVSKFVPFLSVSHFELNSLVLV